MSKRRAGTAPRSIKTMIGDMPVTKSPVRNIKGIGKLGTIENGLSPALVDPKYGNSSKVRNDLIGPTRGKS